MSTTTLPQTPRELAALAEAPPVRRAVSWRSVIIGTLVVAFLSAVTPFNDYVINNSFLTGSYFPPALGMAFMLLVGINGLLYRFRPRSALSTGELGVITAMILVACSVPGQGMMRNLVPLPVTFFYQGRSNEKLWQAFAALKLPDWLFPVPNNAASRNSDVVTYFYSRLPDGDAIPWRAWLIPAVAWGAFLACLYAALLSLAALLRQQWAVNERVPFPLAQLGAAIIEPPAPGRSFNRLMRDKIFWISIGAVFILQSIVALHTYQPAYFPDLTFTFDLTKNLTEQPWTFLVGDVKRATLQFTFVGVTYFIQSRVGFSLWAIFLIEMVLVMIFRNNGSDIPQPMWDDQHVGSCLVFLLGTLWVGRNHWRLVARQALGLDRQSEQGDYATRARIFLLATAGMFMWLLIVGVSAAFAVAIVALILATHVIIARVVAETGLPYMRVQWSMNNIMSNFSPTELTGRDMFFSGVSSYFGPVASRESVLPNALHGMLIADADDGRPQRAARGSIRGIIAVIVWALAVACVVSVASSLWCYYHYAIPLNKGASNVINDWGSVNLPQLYVGNPLVDHRNGVYPPKPHNSMLQIGLGAGITVVLMFGALRYASWPFMPVAYLASQTWYIRGAWWSILVGWCAKVLILRFGGASLYQRLRPAFLGMIIGEAIATGFWLLVAIALVSMGKDYEVIRFLPQ